MTDLLVIVHGRLLRTSSARGWARAELRLREIFGAGVEIQFTGGPGDATLLARKALESGTDWLAAAGGDGLFHEVVNGFFEAGKNIRPSAALSFIPWGSGNDWARTLEIMLSPLDAISALPRARMARVDVGLVSFRASDGSVGERVFLNVAEAGVGGRLVALLNEGFPLARTRIGYRLGSIAAALAYVPQKLDLVIDGVPLILTRPALSLIVASGRYFGSGMKCAPTARPDDGLFEVIIIGDFGRAELLCKIHLLFSGTHLSDPKVFHRSAQTIDAASDEEVLLELDGELVGTLPASFRVLPHALAIRL